MCYSKKHILLIYELIKGDTHKLITYILCDTAVNKRYYGITGYYLSNLYIHVYEYDILFWREFYLLFLLLRMKDVKLIDKHHKIDYTKKYQETSVSQKEGEVFQNENRTGNP